MKMKTDHSLYISSVSDTNRVSYICIGCMQFACLLAGAAYSLAPIFSRLHLCFQMSDIQCPISFSLNSIENETTHYLLKFAVRLSERCPLSGLLFSCSSYDRFCVTQRARDHFITHYLASHMYSRVYKLCFKCVSVLCL